VHYLITGHTGFKGSWLALMLKELGHTVSGVALDPAEKSLFTQCELSPLFQNDLRTDIRDLDLLKKSFQLTEADVLVHLAAQPLVRQSYLKPIETHAINVMGTLNVLEASEMMPGLKAALIITTDKVYKNKNQLTGYVESDPLGGDDPYSASKAAADIATQSWIKNFADIPMAIARAGNVIGGGDYAEDRIVPDIINSFSNHRTVSLRYPKAIRPWQHVLDCLNGYLHLIESMISSNTAGEWNFGPELNEIHTVADLVNEFSNYWEIQKPWEANMTSQPEEAGYLLLDSSKARMELGWKDKLNFENSVRLTNDWYADKSHARERTQSQIENFLSSK
jgi:CDP-glucose 4,6-dehydratase